MTGLVSKAHSHTLVSTRSIDALQFEYFDALTHNVTQAVDLDGSGSIGLPEFISLIAASEQIVENPLGAEENDPLISKRSSNLKSHTLLYFMH